MKGGCKTVSGVMDVTRAGKGRGSCKLLVAQVVEYAAAERPPVIRSTRSGQYEATLVCTAAKPLVRDRM